MLNFSRNNQNSIDDVYWLRQTTKDGVPADCRGSFNRLLNKFVLYYKELIDDLIQNSGGTITFPMDTDLIENYLTGFEIDYIPFDNSEIQGKIEGFWEQDEENPFKVRIFYNISCCPERQRFTKIHELIHFCQSLDNKFQHIFDVLIINDLLPFEVIKILLDRATDKATAIYLMPNEYFVKKYYEIKSVQGLSDYFKVSAPSIIYRIKECGLPILQQAN
jgi:hypothetical protein